MPLPLKTRLFVGTWLLQGLLAGSPAAACTDLGHLDRFNLNVNIVDEGEWGECYSFEPERHYGVIAATYQTDPPRLDPPESTRHYYDEEVLGVMAEPQLAPATDEGIAPLEAEGDFEEGEIINLEQLPQRPRATFDDFPQPYVAADHVLGYRTNGGGITWIPGDDDQLGWFSFGNTGRLTRSRSESLLFAMDFHFLDGPVTTDMPPRLFDFAAGYQRREWIRPNFGWDFVFRFGVFSDFEGSADEGLRFPSHVVTFWRLSPTLTGMAGIDYLDWDTLPLLPVVGLVWIPNDDFRFDLAFPRPRMAMRIMESDTWLALGGEIEGGTWAIERNDTYDDNVTYSDLRLVFAIETMRGNGPSSTFEIGYVFSRDLEYRSGGGDFSPDEALMIRLSSRH